MTGAPSPGSSGDREAAVALRDVSKRFGGVAAVAGVTFELAAGSITGLIGPNGAGKTTLLNLITGFFPPTGGRIAVAGRDVTGWRPHRVASVGVARTYQNILLLDSETVTTNVQLGCHLAAQRWPWPKRGSSDLANEGRRLVDELLTNLNLWDVADAEVAQQPYGVRRRVEIARALAARPSLLILDEPTAGMTRDESDEIGKIVEAVRSGGTTVLLVEHNVRLVKELCDEVLVLEWGRLIARDTAHKIWDHASVRSAYLGELADEVIEELAEGEGGSSGPGGTGC